MKTSFLALQNGSSAYLEVWDRNVQNQRTLQVPSDRRYKWEALGEVQVSRSLYSTANRCPALCDLAKSQFVRIYRFIMDKLDIDDQTVYFTQNEKAI